MSMGKRKEHTFRFTANRIEESARKRSEHQMAMGCFRIEAAAYGSQPEGNTYDLDGDDVVYFRLAGGPREDEKPEVFV